MSFWQELKRRRVVRFAIMYLVASWAIIQVAATVFPVLELPAWTVRLVVLLAILGLPPALVLAWAFDITPDGVERTDRTRIPVRVLAGALTIAVVAAGGWFALGSVSRARGAALDQNLVAVLPFRVSGGGDLASFGEGMVDLMAVKLTGAPRAVDPRTALAAWRRVDAETAGLEDALDVAAGLGAGKLIIGSLVGTGTHVTLTATLHDVATGRALATHSEPAHTDSLTYMVDRMVAALLSLEAGESERNLAALTSTSLPALRAYLSGNTHYRHGRYRAAITEWETALDADSTFVLAALNIPDAAGMTLNLGHDPRPRAQRLMARYSDRFSAADRAYYEARFRMSASANRLDQIAALERLTQRVPDRPEVWYLLGDYLFHNGGEIGLADWLSRSRAAFMRAFELDSTYFLPVQHLVWTSLFDGDTSFLRRVPAEFLRDTTKSGGVVALRETVALLRSDTSSLHAIRGSLMQLSTDVLAGYAVLGQVWPNFTVSVDSLRLAAQEMLRRAAGSADRASAARSLRTIELNAGRPAAAAAAIAGASEEPRVAARRIVNEAIYWDGDTAAARAAVATLNGSTDSNDRCALATWHAWLGHAASVPALAQQLTAEAPVCQAIVLAVLAQREGRTDADVRLAALDSLVRQGYRGPVQQANITVARIAAARGNHQLSHDAARRVYNNLGGQNYRSTFLELEGRAAAALGRRDEAITAYTAYLRLRVDPEPAVKPQVDRVRAELDALMRSGR